MAAPSSPLTDPNVRDYRIRFLNQRMAEEQLRKAAPVECLPARAPVQPLVPEPSDHLILLPQRAVVRRASVVMVVAPELGVERCGLILDLGRVGESWFARASCVLDLLRAGLAVTVLGDAIAGVDVQPRDSARALAEMRNAGAEIVGT